MLPFNLRSELFWDVDFENLHAENNKQIIVERVYSYGKLSELKDIERYYGKSRIVNIIKKIGYLDPKTFEFVLSYYQLKAKDFLCYTKKQLQVQHWV
ncbi:MAG: hypothetical protein HC831_05645 [Chloroflexia bacterium]|nr:hypothetical protein [Chloroflexia bacterium]